MNIFGLDISFGRKSQASSIDAILRRLEAINASASGISVTPENCMKSPTVQAIVSSVSRRISTLPIKVMQTTESDGRTRKEHLPNHPVTRLLANPNDWQDRLSFWLDATSWLLRYGNYYALKGQGVTGPIRRLTPLLPAFMKVEQDTENGQLIYTSRQDGVERIFTRDRLVHARGPARNGWLGDSPIEDVKDAIALEIAAEEMGGSVFGNGAMPSIVFKFEDGYDEFESEEEKQKFLESFQAAYTGIKRFKAMILPKGMDYKDPVPIENEKAQFLATRQYQRTVIAGAFGVPPHLVGDLTSGTFNNVEQQSLDFVMSVVLPYVRIFEAALERSLLTDDDRRRGVIIRFNIDAALRGDFKTRQEGLNIQRQAGVINANDWREMENMNPISEEDGGEEYWRKGPSGQDAAPPAGEDGGMPDEGAEDNADPEEGEESNGTA